MGLFTQYMEYKGHNGTSIQTLGNRYSTVRNHLSSFGRNIVTVEDARELVDMLLTKMSIVSANQLIGILRGFGRWIVESELTSENPFQPIKAIKGGVPVYHRDAFTTDEVNRILEAMRTHPTGWRFHDFTAVLFFLGLRPAEAVGLKWQYVELAARRVTICETLINDRANKLGWVCKSTKTGRSRVLPLNEKLVSLFAGRRPQNPKPNDLVFTDKRGKPVPYDRFRDKIWSDVLEKAGVTYRPPYMPAIRLSATV
ncbi:MAG: tyrosine-type recombinase/integrase [Cyanobacteria bacterium P01_D01_bin.56]